jgi:ABC-type multidrug transport system ATPase subunit
MNVLTSRNLKDYIVEGDVKVNGVSIGSGIKHISAYVQQEDIFYSTLTVRETLTFRVSAPALLIHVAVTRTRPVNHQLNQ